jgi:hypothetical protein
LQREKVYLPAKAHQQFGIVSINLILNPAYHKNPDQLKIRTTFIFMKTIITLLILCITINTKAQDKEQVKTAVQDYIDAFYDGDTNKLHRSIIPELYKTGWYRHPDSSSYVPSRMTFSQAHSYVARVAKRGPDPKLKKELATIEIYDVTDKTASTKVTAWWGIDYILLSKINGKWMITHVLWQSPENSR